MTAVWRILALALIVVTATSQSSFAQSRTVVTGGGFQPASQVLFATDFTGVPIGNFPSGLKYVRGPMEVVMVDGLPMLRSTGNAEFIIPLAAPLPNDFTLEFDLVARNSNCCAGEELAFEGSPQLNRSAGSAWVAWHHQGSGILGGGYDYGTSTVRFSEELQNELIGQRGSIQVMMNGTQFKLWTNGRHTGQVDGYPNCAVKTEGTDSLIGIVSGAEPSDPDEDVEYTGNLARATAMDICETKGKNRPDDIDDEQVWCVASLSGTSRMNVKVTVSSAAGDGGAYLKATADTGASTSQVTGNCAQSKMAIYRADYPRRKGGGGGGPDGQAITDEFGTVTFVVGGLGRLRVGRYPADPSQALAGSPKSGWALHVIRKIR